MSRRRIHRTPDLTSLLDVLFILIFASLIRTSAMQNAEANQPPPAPLTPPLPVTPPDVAVLRTRALSNLDKELASRKPLVIRVARTGVVQAVEADGKTIPLDVPLLEHSPDPDIGVSYLGERSAELRVCRIAAVHLQATSLAGYLVILAPAVPLADLPHALYQGLHRDLDRCLTDQRGLATIVDPAVLTAP